MGALITLLLGVVLILFWLDAEMEQEEFDAFKKENIRIIDEIEKQIRHDK